MPRKSRTDTKPRYKRTKFDGTGKIDDIQLKCDIDDSSKIETQLGIKSNHNIVNNLINVRTGTGSTYFLHKASRDVLIRNISSFSSYKNVIPFDRRVTCIEWHPKHPRILAVASKGGDILLWNYETSMDEQEIIAGKGAGGSVQAMKFNSEMPDRQIFTASVDGSVTSWDHSNKTCRMFLKSAYSDNWYTTVDVCPTGGHLIVGDNTGFLTMLSLCGQEIWKTKLHKNKISHVEYNTRQPWLVATSSIDRTVKLWDLRNMNGTSALTVLHHDQAVNSAYFSSTDAARLLTTDQHSQLRVYKGPLWELERVIPHPHRQFQHLTPIRAAWHPFEDIVVVGRYPDKKFSEHVPGEMRTIDFIDAETGKYKCRFPIRGICSRNCFNILGDALASGIGFNVCIWRPDWKGK